VLPPLKLQLYGSTKMFIFISLLFIFLLLLQCELTVILIFESKFEVCLILTASDMTCRVVFGRWMDMLAVAQLKKTVSLSSSVVHRVAELTTSAVLRGILPHDQVHFDTSVLIGTDEVKEIFLIFCKCGIILWLK